MSYHLYDIVELYSNASGTIQFVELAQPGGGGPGENQWDGRRLVSTDGVNTQYITFPLPNVGSATTGKHVLVATAGFQTLTGITPNYIIPDNFLYVSGGTVKFGATNDAGTGQVDQVVHGALPTDHENSLNIAIDTTHAQSNGANTPQNFAGAVGHISNNAPVMGEAIPNKLTGAGQGLEFNFAGFTESDGDPVTYTATLDNDAALPAWLGFDAGTRTFSGTPATSDSGSITVKVTASDGFGGSATDSFVIKVIKGQVINGTSGQDTLAGATLADSISGLDGNDVLSGSGGNDTIRGAAGNDSIAGGIGTDSLVGGGGADTLNGGGGADRFVIAEQSSKDVIQDFTGDSDVLQLQNGIFTVLGGSGAVNPEFVQTALRSQISATSGDADAYLKYATNTGQLYYDPDGSGPGILKLIVTVTSSGTPFDPSDIVVI